MYLAFGIAELILSFFMMRYLVLSVPTAEGMGFRAAYFNAFSVPMLWRTVMILFLVGFAVFGSFTYLGDYLVETTGYNILTVGIIYDGVRPPGIYRRSPGR